jgi:hypothetical protein
MEGPTAAPKPSAALFFKKFLRLTSIFVLAIPSSLEEKRLLAQDAKSAKKNESSLSGLDCLGVSHSVDGSRLKAYDLLNGD